MEKIYCDDHSISHILYIFRTLFDKQSFHLPLFIEQVLFTNRNFSLLSFGEEAEEDESNVASVAKVGWFKFSFQIVIYLPFNGSFENLIVDQGKLLF